MTGSAADLKSASWTLHFYERSGGEFTTPREGVPGEGAKKIGRPPGSKIAGADDGKRSADPL